MTKQILKTALYSVVGKSAHVRKTEAGGHPAVGHDVRLIYYLLLSKPMQLNAWIYRKWRAPRTGVVKAHLGPGQTKYLNGWVNVDANIVSAKIDVWADFRHPLPFPDATVDVFFSHHVIEHLPDAVLPFHFRDMYRCLKPGGVIRIGGPHGENAIRKFLENDIDWFFSRKKSIGGRYTDFIMCGGEHISILTFSYMKELAESAGFADVRQCQVSVETFHDDVIDAAVLKMEEREGTPAVPHTLTIEAIKPGIKPTSS